MKATSDDLFIEQQFLSYLKMKLQSSDNFMAWEFYNYFAKCAVDDQLLKAGKLVDVFFYGSCRNISHIMGP